MSEEQDERDPQWEELFERLDELAAGSHGIEIARILELVGRCGRQVGNIEYKIGLIMLKLGIPNY